VMSEIDRRERDDRDMPGKPDGREKKKRVLVTCC
jgi:hypothetical protein